MGFTPQQVNAMTPWQWTATFEGYFDAHASAEAKREVLMSDADFAIAEKMLES